MTMAFGMPHSISYPVKRLKHFSVFVDIAPVALGHLLIVPNTHVSCAADCSNDSIDELASVIREIDQNFQRVFGLPILIFEHGSRGIDRSAGSCTEHAHIHALPFIDGFIDRIGRDFIGEFHSISHLARIPLNTAYLLAGLMEQCRFNIPAHGVPCQYLRRIAANLLRVPHGRWEDRLIKDPRGNRDVVMSTISKLKDYFNTP